MKTFYKFLTLISTAALLATSCVNEDPAYKNEIPAPSTPQSGFLSLGELTMRVVFDTQTDTDDTGDQTQRPLSHITRTQPNVEQFWVEIFDAENRSILKKQYAELKTDLLLQKLELPVATYRLEVYSDQTIPDAEWEFPTYSASQELRIEKGVTTQIDEVVCTLSSIKVTVMCSADLASRLNHDKSKATVSLGTTKVDFAIGEMRAVYFKAAELTNTLNFLLQGEFSANNKPVKLSKQIRGVKAGQWRKISLVVDYADKGDIKFDIKVEGFQQDEEVVVNGTKGLWEQIYDEEPVIDPDAPLILWPGHSLIDPFRLSASMFDAQGNCIEPFTLDIEAPNGIETCLVDITSTSPVYVAKLASLGISGPLDLTNFDTTSPAYTILDNIFRFPMNNKLKGMTSVDFNLAMTIPMLYSFDGTHTLAFDVTDANGLNTKAQIKLVVDKSNEALGPVIEWEGYDLEQVYPLSNDMTIKVNVTAESLIKSFIVEIDSETLKGMLLGINMTKLTSPFDLCTIEDPEKTFLSETVGFKTGDQVEGESSVSFDITMFAPVLMQLGKPGERFNFRFEVTDYNGKTTHGAIQLVVAEEQPNE